MSGRPEPELEATINGKHRVSVLSISPKELEAQQKRRICYASKAYKTQNVVLSLQSDLGCKPKFETEMLFSSLPF